jgi:MarR family transcriptional regulator, organic hydroperoxide resistance regulator
VSCTDTIGRMRKRKTPAVSSANPRRQPRASTAKAAAKDRKQLDFDLERAVPYLLARAGVRMGQAFSKELRRFELTLTEWRVCAALHHRPEQRLSELAEHTSAEASTLSRVVEGMLQRGLLVRGRSDEDGRALALSLTDVGRDTTLRIIPLAQLFERVALAGFSNAQADTLREMLRSVYTNLAMFDPDE